MLVDQLIAGRPFSSGADGFNAREAVDKHLEKKAQEILVADAQPVVVKFDVDAPADAPVVPIRKRDALRAAWGTGDTGTAEAFGAVGPP